MGNMLSGGARTLTWEHGRELKTVTLNGQTWTYTYDANGMRTKRTNGTTTYEYIYNGDKLVRMIKNGEVIDIAYIGDMPLSMTYNGATYYYVLNGQGDVIGLTDSDGGIAIGYTYGAWGKSTALQANDTLAPILVNVNPLRYRGYVYDTETALYYLQSRYYDPAIGRFISADAFVSTGQGIIGNNMFAYCGNNPVSRTDIGGYFWDTVLDVISLGVSIANVIENPDDPMAWLGVAADVASLVVPCVSGGGALVRAATKADDVVDAVKTIDKVDDAVDTVKTGWHVGDDITNLTKAGNTPSWSTVRQRYWKNEAYYHPELYPDDLDRLKKGLAPIGEDGFSMELHHPLGRDGNNFFIFEPLTQTQHKQIHYGD